MAANVTQLHLRPAETSARIVGKFAAYQNDPFWSRTLSNQVRNVRRKAYIDGGGGGGDDGHFEKLYGNEELCSTGENIRDLSYYVITYLFMCGISVMKRLSYKGFLWGGELKLILSEIEINYCFTWRINL